MRQPALDQATLHHRRVVVVGHHGVLRAGAFCVADHAEHRLVLRHAVDGEVGVEDLVAAVLAVGLREHHQLDIAGVTAQLSKGRHEVIDFIVTERKAKFGVRLHQCAAALCQHIHMGHGRGLLCLEQARRGAAFKRKGFCHAVVQQGQHVCQLGVSQWLACCHQTGFRKQAVFRDSFNSFECQAAVAGDVSGLAGPR